MILGNSRESGDRQGYLSAQYSHSLAEFGTPLELTRAGGWLIAQDIPGDCHRDARGCYPLFCCHDWSALPADLAGLPGDLVAVSLVCDPLNAPEAEELAAIFPDICYHYKDHYVAELCQPLGRFVSAHHQRNARKASRAVRVEQVTSLREILPDWNRLYEMLIERHQIEGMAAFSGLSFARLMEVPGLTAFTAKSGEEIVGIALWIVQGNQAYYHLAAYTVRGYELKASFALFWECLEAFASAGVERVLLGGGAGVFAADEGLSRFKQGWSNDVRKAYFCGRILDRGKYADLVARTGQADNDFFPAYRARHRTKAA
jgi:hypothetical protein